MITDDYHFEILPTMDAADGIPFGIGLDVGLDEGGFVPGSTDWATQDTENSQNGTTNFGRDRLLGPTWNFQLHINRDDPIEALETLGTFRTAWHWLHGRETPGMVTALRYRVGGRTRRIYGRPRRFEAPPDNKILGGMVPVSTDFKAVDAFHYDDEDTVVVLSTGGLDDNGTDSGGGWVFPVVFPYVSLPPTTQQTQVLVGGDAPAYPIVRFNGPVVNPRLTSTDWELSLDYTIPDGQYVEIDTRPWRMTAMLNGNASVAGFLGRRQRLSKIRFMPGRFQAYYSGFSSNVSTCEVRWANTHNSI